MRGRKNKYNAVVSISAVLICPDISGESPPLSHHSINLFSRPNRVDSSWRAVSDDDDEEEEDDDDDEDDDENAPDEGARVSEPAGAPAERAAERVFADRVALSRKFIKPSLFSQIIK